MATGGEFGADVIHHFNGGLFADAEVIDLTWDEIETPLNSPSLIGARK